MPDASDVFFAIPTRGAIHNQTVSRLERIRAENPSLGPIAYSAGHLSSHETREQVAAYFMQTEKDVLVMLDDDVVPPADILGMVEHLEEFDVVGAAVPMFQPKVAPIPLLMAWNYVPDQQAWQTLDDVWGCTGVIEKLDAPYFPMEYNPAGTITDDLAFCRRVRGIGMRVACSFDHYCEHHSVVPLLKLAEGMSKVIEANLKR